MWGLFQKIHSLARFGGPVVHRPKNPPNLGRMGCLCQLISPKGQMIWFLFFHYMFLVAKWVRKYPPCALHKTFLVRCLRKYSVRWSGFYTKCFFKPTERWNFFCWHFHFCRRFLNHYVQLLRNPVIVMVVIFLRQLNKSKRWRPRLS